MLTWGFLLLIGSAIASLIIFLGHVGDVVDVIGKVGFLRYISLFFTTEMTQDKIAFMVAAVLLILGLVLYIVGLVRSKDEKKSIIPAELSKYVRDTKGEFKKIVWPTLPATVRNVGVVLAMCALTAIVVVVADAALGGLIQLLLGIKL